MVIISTRATEVIIQAVSPELGVQFVSTAFLGSASAAQAGGAAAASGAGAAAGAAAAGGAAVGAWACVGPTEPMLRKMPRRALNASVASPARDSFLYVMIELLFASIVGAGITAPLRRFRRCGCG